MIFSLLKWGALLKGAIVGVQIAWLGPRRLSTREQQELVDRYLVKMGIDYTRQMLMPVPVLEAP